MPNKYKEKIDDFDTDEVDEMNTINNDYDVVSNIDDFPILSCLIRKLKILCLGPLILEKYLAILF